MTDVRYLGDARPGSWCPCSDSPACEDDMECQELSDPEQAPPVEASQKEVLPEP